MGFFGRDKQEKQDGSPAAGGAEYTKRLDAYRGAMASLEEFDRRREQLRKKLAGLKEQGVLVNEKLRRAQDAKAVALRRHAAGEIADDALAAARREFDFVERETREHGELFDAVESVLADGENSDLERTNLLNEATHAQGLFYQFLFEVISVEIREIIGGRLNRAFAVALLCQHRPRDFGEFMEALFGCRTVQQRAGALEAAMSARAAIEKEYLGD